MSLDISFRDIYWASRVSRFEIGDGPKIYSFIWRGICFNFHLLPFGGSVHRVWASKKKWKNITIIAGGPIANIICAVAFWNIFRDFAAISLVMGVFNLIPRKEFDGYNILMEFARDKEGVLVR